MKNYLSLSIWGGGPGRPHDNAYIAKKLLLNEDGLYLSFEDGEECRVFRPEGVVLSDQGIRIENTEKIVWKFYCYGEPQREAALTTITWQRIDRQQVRLSARGWFRQERILSVRGEIALSAFGEISGLLKASGFNKDQKQVKSCEK